jgi:hypothetical protein
VLTPEKTFAKLPRAAKIPNHQFAGQEANVGLKIGFSQYFDQVLKIFIV